MKKCVAILFIHYFIISTGYSQNAFQLVLPIEDSVESKILKEKRKIWLYVPASKRQSDSIQYRVLYLLDAETYFTLVCGLLHLKSQWEKSCPEMIVVGIPNIDRIKDLTPTHSLISPEGTKAEEFQKSSGGGENFTQFLKEELITYVDSKYPTKPERTFVGVSLGGLLVLNTLVHHPELFENYVCIDPSTWWDNRKLLERASIELPRNKTENKKFFLAVSNNMNPEQDSVKQVAPNTRPIVKFSNELKSSTTKLHYFWKYYEKENHHTVGYPAFNDALQILWK